MSVGRDLRLYSVNDHLVLPPDAFTTRMPARFAVRAPRVVEGAGADGRTFLAMKGLTTADLAAIGVRGLESLDAPPGDAWFYDGRPFPTSGTSVLSTWRDIDFRHVGSFRYRDLDPAVADPRQRLACLDRDGVLASACLPFVEFPSYAGQYFLMTDDREYAAAAVVAYNDFVLDEWVAAAPDRYIPVIVVPLWDPVAAAEEITRMADLGARAITFPEDPAKLDLPSIHDRAWDPTFAAAAEAGLPLIVHVGSSTWLPPMPRDITMAAGFAIAGSLSPLALFDWLFSDVFVRHPGLQVLLAEGNVGWIPWGLWRADYVWERHSGWGGRRNPERPSETFARHMYASALPFEDTAADAIRAVGADNVCFETDFPHPDMSYPDTAPMLGASLASLDDASVDKVLRDNARRLFRFPGPSS